MWPITFCAICEEILTWTNTGQFRPDDSCLGQLKKYHVPKPRVFDYECPLCAMFECLLDPEFNASQSPPGPFRVNMEPDVYDTLLRLGRDSLFSRSHPISRGSICIRKDDDGDWSKQYNAFQYYLERQLAKESISSPSKSKSTWSLSSLNQIISWLSNCKNSHPDCNAKTKSDLQLPKRLVDVDPDGCISAPPTSEAEFQQLSISSIPPTIESAPKLPHSGTNRKPTQSFSTDTRFIIEQSFSTLANRVVRRSNPGPTGESAQKQ